MTDDDYDLLPKVTALRETCERAAEQLRARVLPAVGPRGANEPAITFRIRTGGVDDSELRTQWAQFQADNPQYWDRDFGDLRTPSEVRAALKWGEQQSDEELLPVTKKLLGIT